MQSQNQATATAILAPATDTHKVLRNTYLLLALTTVPTFIGAIAGIVALFGIGKLLFDHPVLSFLTFIVVAIGLIFGIKKNKDNFWGVVLLLLLTGVMGLVLGPVLITTMFAYKNGALIIALTSIGTGVIFLAMAVLAMMVKKDLKLFTNILTIGLVLLVPFALANIYFHIPILDLAISGGAVLLFSGFILSDISNIVKGGESNYVIATMNLYLDIFNVFFYLLDALLELFGQTKED